MKIIIIQRNKTQFSSLEDFFIRVNPREDEIRALIHSGSLDSLDTKGSRAALLWAFASWQKRKKPMGQQPSLFEDTRFDTTGFDTTGTITPIPDLPAEDPVEKLRREFFVLGFLCSCHPIVLFKDIIQQYNTVKAKHLPKFIGKKVIFAGWLITGKVVKTKHGDPMKFLTFEDETSIIETIFFPKPYALFCHMLDYGKPYLLYGKLDSSWGAITLIVEKTRPIHIVI